MFQNAVKAKWVRAEPAFGAWCSTGSPFVAELLALGGFDYVCLDAQHGLLGYERAVANCRIFPLGHRSYGPARLRQAFGGSPEDLNREVLCVVMIETALGVENADEICSVPGVDAVYIGPADLAITYGLPPGLELEPGPLTDGITSVLRACQVHGIAGGIHCASGGDGRTMVERGFKMATIASDAMLLSAAARAELADARG